jgi:signal transduction histidine kinase
MKTQMGLIGQEIKELTLASGDAKTLLWELLRKVKQSLQARVGFLILFENLPSTSQSEPDLMDQARLVILQERLETLLLEMSSPDENENQIRTAILASLQKDLSLAHWEICPLSNQKVLGWLILGSNRKMGLNHRLEEALHTPLCLALKTAELQYEREREKRYRQLGQKLTETIHHSQELETILHSAIAQTSQALEVTRGLVLMLRYAEPIFSDRREITAPNIEVQPLTQWALTQELETSLTTFPITRSPLCLQAWQQAPTPIAESSRTHQSEPTFLNKPLSPSAWLLTPLMGRSSGRPESRMVLGFLLLQNDQPRQWQQEEQELVNWVSTEASTAIIHNKTLERVQSLVDERTAQLQRSLDVQAKLYETSRHQVEQLQQLNELKDEFLATMSHELNTPLATMKMAIQMLHQPHLSSERREKYLAILDQEWHREYNLIKDLLTLQEVEDQGSSIEVEAINLQELLSQVGEELQSKWEEKGLSLTINLGDFSEKAEELVIYSDTESVRRIFLELLTNAAKYSTANTTVEVRIFEFTAHWIKIDVINIGYGIASGEKSYIFDQFRRGKGATQKAIPGTGLGLALVKSLVQHLHGKIDLDSEYNPDGVGETKFRVTLPRSLNEVSS